MLSKTIQILTGILLFISLSQTAQAGPYGTLGLSIESIQPTDRLNNFTGAGINARLGYNFGRYFGLESEGQIGLSGEGEKSSFLTNGEIQQKTTHDYKGAWALYLRPQLPVSENLTLSLRTGFGVKYFDRTVDNPFLGMTDPTILVIEDTSTLLHGALGASVEYNFGIQNRDGLRLDFTQRHHPGSLSDGEEEAFSNRQVTVSYSRKF